MQTIKNLYPERGADTLVQYRNQAKMHTATTPTQTTIPRPRLLSQTLQTTLFLLTWRLLHLYVTRHGPPPRIRHIVKLHNTLQIVFSLVLLVIIILPPIISSPVPHSLDLIARCAYHYSKTYEYLDILLVVLSSPSSSPIALHFAFHHLTTPWLTLVRVLHISDGWRVGAGLNAMHHAGMYAHFAGWGVGTGWCLFTGMVQLVVGLGWEAVVVRGKLKRGGEEGVWGNIVAIGLGGVYAVLFGGEIWEGRRERERDKERGHVGVKETEKVKTT
ncbi:hypothetical protein GE09DRAFT_1106339 [Coniochaeta sp. 2T2.1]|nr:hypothetical protein GE09DRAFT_1106339 [Coniochaeta sp. 2T2.1]